IPLLDKPVTIGRRTDCDVRPNSALVSGHHCCITKRPFGVFVEDLDSRNGTCVNARRIAPRTRTELSDQDTIHVGDVVFTVHMFAAVTADTEEGHNALREWVVTDSRLPPPGPEGSTVFVLDLDSLPMFGPGPQT